MNGYAIIALERLDAAKFRKPRNRNSELSGLDIGALCPQCPVLLIDTAVIFYKGVPLLPICSLSMRRHPSHRPILQFQEHLLGDLVLLAPNTLGVQEAG